MTGAPPRGGLGGAAAVAAGIASIAVLFVLYARYMSYPGGITPDAAEALGRAAYAFYVLLAAAFASIAYGMRRLHASMARPERRGALAVIARHTQGRRAKRVFVAVFAAYGVFFSLTSGTLVYQPEVVFSYHYGAQIPSAELVACCDEPGYAPKILAYLTEHVGLQIIPVNLVLQVAVSYLVALNAAVAVGAFAASRARRSMSGVGAITGLFVACPTCVGSVASILLGTASGISLSVALVQFQTGLIAVSIPVLLATPFLLARKMRDLPGACGPDPLRT